MNAPDPNHDPDNHDAAIDAYVRRHFRVEPQEDPSGLDGSRAVAPSEPADFESAMQTLFPQLTQRSEYDAA